MHTSEFGVIILTIQLAGKLEIKLYFALRIKAAQLILDLNNYNVL